MVGMEQQQLETDMEVDLGQQQVLDSCRSSLALLRVFKRSVGSWSLGELVLCCSCNIHFHDDGESLSRRYSSLVDKWMTAK